MNVPFSLPYIDKNVIDEVNDIFTNTGWLTSGPKVIEFESELRNYTQASNVVCVNSWTSGAMLMLRWFGVGVGDEVIIPSYTYAATAMAVLNVGARPVMVDVNDDFTIDPEAIEIAITTKTKAIIPVDVGGWPADYNRINEIVASAQVSKLFKPRGNNQKKLNRILVIADAAHSIGGLYYNESVGRLTDATVFSFHSVKNITTGEGGAVCINLPKEFDSQSEYKFLKSLSLNGQNKSAFEKSKSGSWKYDIIDQGLKINMPDVCAAIGLAQIRQYQKSLLPEREKIFKTYDDFFSNYEWAIIPLAKNNYSKSSYHLYMLRVAGSSEDQRDEIIAQIIAAGVGVNVHYMPLPILTLFKNLGYKIQDHPKAMHLYSNEITLPVYNGLDENQLARVCETVVKSVEFIFNNQIN